MAHEKLGLVVHSLGLQASARWGESAWHEGGALLGGVVEVGAELEVVEVVEGLLGVLVVVGVLGFVFVQAGNESRVEFKIFVVVLVLHEAVVALVRKHMLLVGGDSAPLCLPQVVNELVELHLEVQVVTIVEAVLLSARHKEHVRL